MALDHATDVRLKDGTLIFVHSPGGGRVAVTTPVDDTVSATGLAAYQSEPDESSGMAIHLGMPVEVVRAYCRAHGGVAEAGETALRLLKSMTSAAEPIMGEPVTDSQPPPADEAAPEAPLPRAGGQHNAEPATRIQLDELTEAVIEARRAVADFAGPVQWKREWGKHRADWLPETAALWKRITKGSGLASRLIVVT